MQLAPFRLPDAPARSDLVAKYFRGPVDPTRVRILELLRDEGELSVGELVARLASRSRRCPTISPAFAGAGSSLPAVSTASSTTGSPTSASSR
ncbi:MAG: ArsR family transcriptional regulator [Thermoleophilia bacterium]|nr:ArsR family transcriptional regulator [Thermoleophilia bacterium]